jgi:hypothetical protein
MACRISPRTWPLLAFCDTAHFGEEVVDGPRMLAVAGGTAGALASSFLLAHPAEAYVDLKRCGHVGPIWGCRNDFRQEEPACPQACCTMDSGCVTTVT